MRTLLILLVIAGGAFAIYSATESSKEESGEARTIQGLPPSVQHTALKMDREALAALLNEYELKKKKKSVAYIMWLLFGFHYIYTRQIGLQFAFWFTGGGLGIWWLVDLFRMPSIVRACNEQIARQALQTLALGNAFRSDVRPPTP